MKKKLLLSSILLLTISPIFALVSCENKTANETNENIEELKKSIEKIKADKENDKAKFNHELNKLNKQLNDANQENASFESKNNELNQQLEELINTVDKLSGTKIKRNNKSAKEFFFAITNFLADDVPNAIKTQNPKSFESNRDLFNKIKNSIIDTRNDLKDTPEDFANLWTWESAILYSLNRASLVAKYIDDPTNPVTIITPKLEYMDELFDWRIHDLELIIKEVENNTYESTSAKEKLLKTLQEAKAAYEDAKNNSSLLSHQITNWFKLEQESDKGVVGKFINLKSEHNRSLNPVFKLPNFRISLFPVYRQIVDEEFKETTRNKLASLLRDYKFLVVKKAEGFINSVSYDRLNKKIKAIILKISAALLPDNLTYFNEFEVWEDVDKFILEAKSVLLESFFVETDDKKQQMDIEVDQALDETIEGSLAKEFKETYELKAKKNNDESIYLYRDFYNKYKKMINQIKNDRHSNYTESFDRYIKYLTLKRELEISKQIINLHNDLNEDLDNSELKELLKWDNSAKYDNQIRIAQENKARDKKAYQEQQNNVDNLIVEFNQETEEAESYLENISEITKEITTLFINNFDPTTDESKNVIGVWGHMYGDENSKKIISLIREHNRLVQTIYKNYSDGEYTEEQLLEKIQEIINSAKNFKKILFGSEEETNAATIYGQFNKAHQDYYYGIDFEQYNTQIQIVEDYKKIIIYFAKYNLDNFDIDSFSKELKNNLEKTKLKIAELENIFNDDGIWKELKYADNTLKPLQNLLLQNLNNLKQNLEELVLQLPSSQEEFNEDLYKEKIESTIKLAKDFLANLGTKDDNMPPLTSFYEETIQNYENDIRRAKNKMKKIPRTAKILSGQEVFVLLRYWKNTSKRELDKTLLDKNNYQDKQLALFLNNEIKFPAHTKESYKNILDVDGSTNSFDIETTEDSKINAQSVYQQFNVLETKYAEALIAWFKDKNDNNKENLLKTRKEYYEYLNTFKEQKIYLSNNFIRFGSDLYIYSEYEPQERIVAANFLEFYAKTQAVTEIMQYLYEKYIK